MQRIHYTASYALVQSHVYTLSELPLVSAAPRVHLASSIHRVCVSVESRGLKGLLLSRLPSSRRIYKVKHTRLY